MQVLYSEGLASHTGPESCVGHREVAGEALTGVRVGRPLSRERKSVRGADGVCGPEGNTLGCVIASARGTLRGLRPRHARTLLVREPGDLLAGHLQWMTMVRIGKARSRSR